MEEEKREPKYNLDFPEDEWEKAATDLESGTIVRDWYDEGLRIIIMRGPGSFNAYIGIPESHPLAGFDYDDIPIKVHGGLTFCGKGKGSYPTGFWWYGWDYSHAGDASFYRITSNSQWPYETGVEWTIKDIKEDIREVIWDFKELIKLAERIKEK